VPNADFQRIGQASSYGRLSSFQRPFYARLMVKWEF
jgi:hypothetical protein